METQVVAPTFLQSVKNYLLKTETFKIVAIVALLLVAASFALNYFKVDVKDILDKYVGYFYGLVGIYSLYIQFFGNKESLYRLGFKFAFVNPIILFIVCAYFAYAHLCPAEKFVENANGQKVAIETNPKNNN